MKMQPFCLKNCNLHAKFSHPLTREFSGGYEDWQKKGPHENGKVGKIYQCGANNSGQLRVVPGCTVLQSINIVPLSMVLPGLTAETERFIL